jgi:DNA-binding XRE family transcriptional regulator
VVKNNIKFIRKKNTAFFQEDMRLLLNISLSTYQSYEEGKRQPKPQMLKEISRLLKCTVDELI